MRLGRGADDVQRFFDARLDPLHRTDDDLANLAYFGTSAALLVPPRTAPSHAADDLLAAFHDLMEVQRPRVRDCGIQTAMCLGLHPEQRPLRTHHEVFQSLRAWAAAGELAAIGVLSVDTVDDAEPQLEIAAEFGLPVVVSASQSPNRVAVEAFVRMATASGVPAPRLVFDGCDYVSLRAVLEAGAVASLDLSPNGLSTDAVAMVHRYGEGVLRRVVFSSAGGSVIDVLACGKAARRLQEIGFAADAIENAMFGNAAALWGLEGVATGSPAGVPGVS